jgi:hypothetical protein
MDRNDVRAKGAHRKRYLLIARAIDFQEPHAPTVKRKTRLLRQLKYLFVAIAHFIDHGFLRSLLHYAVLIIAGFFGFLRETEISFRCG